MFTAFLAKGAVLILGRIEEENELLAAESSPPFTEGGSPPLPFNAQTTLNCLGLSSHGFYTTMLITL